MIEILFWVVLAHLWRDWRSILVIVRPETVIKWHRQDFKCYWRWKFRAGRVGRPRIDLEIGDLIRRMSHENPTWGVPRNHPTALWTAQQIIEAFPKRRHHDSCGEIAIQSMVKSFAVV